MDILNKQISQFNYSDIEAFCQQGIPEGIQIDYKKDFPVKGLSKHFAAFSNTRGGVIIIGVEEDKKTGVPISWVGVNKDAKQIEKIHQEAANVEPIPNYEVHTTDEKNGKIFVLVRIQKGDNTPYYVQNDSNVWVRTGNVSTPIDIASPDGLELLFGNKDKAEKIRNLYLEKAEDVYNNYLVRAERNRQREVDEIKSQGKAISPMSDRRIGKGSCMCRICIQPFFPGKALASPKIIKGNLENIRVKEVEQSFPSLNMEAIPDGILHFTHFGLGKVDCQQIYGQGLICNYFDTVREKDGTRFIPISFIAGRLLRILKFANNFYSHFYYQGTLRGFISVNNANDVFIKEIIPPGSIDWGEDKESFIPSYKWEILTDTNVLKSPEQLKDYYYSLVRDIYWHFGYENISDDVIDAFLKQNGLSI
jgi:hypothetical protein